MSYIVNETHDPQLQSWVESANATHNDFPIQNLPFGVFQRRGSDESPRVGVAIGDQILDLSVCRHVGLLATLAPQVAEACCAPTLNALMALGYDSWSAVRRVVSGILRLDSSANQREQLLSLIHI